MGNVLRVRSLPKESRLSRELLSNCMIESDADLSGV